MCTTIYIKYFLGPINYIANTVTARAMYEEAREGLPCSLNDSVEIETPSRGALACPRSSPSCGSVGEGPGNSVNATCGFVIKTHLLSVQPSHRNAYCS